MTIGEKIREVRRNKRIRQKILAQMIGISQGALANFEKGRRRISVDWLYKISEALTTPMVYFLPEEKDNPRSFPGDPRERRLLLAWRRLRRNDILRTDFLRLVEHLGKARGVRGTRKKIS